jgi:hypothetical protein
VVTGRSIATGENLRWVSEQDYRYLVVSRERIRQFAPRDGTDLKAVRAEGGLRAVLGGYRGRGNAPVLVFRTIKTAARGRGSG